MTFSSNLPECSRQMQGQSDIPCAVYTPQAPYTCEDYLVEIRGDENQILENITWGEIPGRCYFNFTYTERGTYTYNSTILSGMIVVEEDNMIAIILGMIGVAVFYAVLGLLVKIPAVKMGAYLVTMFQVLIMFATIYFREAGESINGVLRMNFWIILILTFAIFMLYGIAYVMKMVDMNKPEITGDPKWIK